MSLSGAYLPPHRHSERSAAKAPEFRYLGTVLLLGLGRVQKQATELKSCSVIHRRETYRIYPGKIITDTRTGRPFEGMRAGADRY